MPLYEYYCPKCNYQIDVIHKNTEKKKELCPSCKKIQLKKKPSLTSFQLKGGGWYKDGYSKKIETPSSKKTTSTPVKKELKKNAKQS